ncbi:hypothetical protein PIB30_112238, partial [Stylosanthes scabra]|nr:hypothetical protein [Stylosanthes scabra]
MATKPILSTHRRRKPRIGVVDQQARMPSHICTTSNVTLTSPNFTRSTHRRGSPRICVESIKYDPMCWTSSNPRMSVEDLFILPHPKSHAYAQNSKHMHGKPRSSCKQHDPRTHVEDQVYAWRTLKNNSTCKAKMKTH